MNRMAVIVGIALALRAVGDDGIRVAMVFNNAPVEQLVVFYSDLTGRKVAIETGVYATVTLHTQEEVTTGEAVRLIEEALREQDVGIFPTTTNAFVASWINSAGRPQPARSRSSRTLSGVAGTTTNQHTRLSYSARRAEREGRRLEAKGLQWQTNDASRAMPQYAPTQAPEDTARTLADPQR